MTAPPPDRRVAIADAAITVLARDGSRGLSHRAVDRELGLSEGSTSFYFRSRQALLGATVERLAALDEADLRQVLGRDGDSPVAELFDLWAGPERRERTMARFELLLASARSDGDGPLTDARAHFTGMATTALADAGARDPAAGARMLVALLEGLLLGAMIEGDAARAEDRDLLTRLGRMLLG